MMNNQILYTKCLVLFFILQSTLALDGSDDKITLDESRNDTTVSETVTVRVYYESLCSDCIQEYPQLPPLEGKLGNYIQLRTLPYGNAKMSEQNGKTIVRCQHGEAECYGNKLHACAIDLHRKTRDYISYNNCLMQRQSNDTAADECGQRYSVDSGPIKACAKGERGQMLLIYFGHESEKVHYRSVPHVRINGDPMPDNLSIMEAVCRAFKNPPKACQH